MSIILKALQKSQHERELQAPETPPLRVDFGDPEPPTRAWWPWSLAALLMAALVLAGALLWSAGEAMLARFLAEPPAASQTAEAPQAPQTPAASQEVAAPAPSQEAEAPEARPVSPAEPTAELPAREPAQLVTPEPAQPVTLEPAQAAAREAAQPVTPEPAQPVPAAAPVPEAMLLTEPTLEPEAPPQAAPVTTRNPVSEEPPLEVAPEPGPVPEPASATSVEAPGPAAPEGPSAISASLLPRRKPEPPPPLPDPQVVQERPQMVVPEDAPQEPEADEAAQDTAELAAAGVTNLTIRPAVPSLRELPVAFQDALPKIRISIHIYDSEPSNRMVRINRRKVREGGRTADGLRVDEITPTGLVLTYKNTQFRYPFQ